MSSTSIEITSFALSLAHPLETARGTIDAREGFLVAVERNGVLGIGEASPLPGWTESHEACTEALERARAEYDEERRRRDPRAALRAALETFDARETPAARHGFAAAIADRRARQDGRALYRHLGGTEHVEHVAVNTTIGDGTPAEAASAAEDALDEGFQCLKVKVGARSIGADVARLRAIREVAPNAEIRADANGAYSLAEARRALAAFEGTGDLAYVEQPLSAADLAGHAALRGESDLRIALDETLSERSISAVCNEGAADVVICKPMVLGGLDRARTASLRARAAGIEPVVTTTIDGAIARAGSTHLAASLAPIVPCGLATASLLEADLVGENPAPVTGGYARVPQRPGTVEATTARAAIDRSRS
jgi:o-succinylbenzoate synthase